jgi:hypothetical protein
VITVMNLLVPLNAGIFSSIFQRLVSKELGSMKLLQDELQRSLSVVFHKTFAAKALELGRPS